MPNELATTRQLSPQAWLMLQSVGEAAYESRKFGLSKREAEVKMAVAYEFGLPITTALSSVYVIDNKPVLAPKLLWARAQAHAGFAGYHEERLEKAGRFEGWRITIERRGMPAISRDFTMTQAAAIGLATKDNWRNYPEDVCYWRAIDRVLHVAFADVCMGLYGADELGADISPDGGVIDTWVTEIRPSTTEPIETTTATTVDLGTLVTQYGADAVMAANGGQIPATDEDVTRVAEALNASH